MVKDHTFTKDVSFCEWLENEIRAAMKQELNYNGMSGLSRHGVARVRAQRILAKLDGIPVPDMKVVCDASVVNAVQEKMWGARARELTEA